MFQLLYVISVLKKNFLPETGMSVPGVTAKWQAVIQILQCHIRIAFNGKAQSSFIGWNAQPATVPVYVYRPEAIFVVSLSGVTKVVFDALFMR